MKKYILFQGLFLLLIANACSIIEVEPGGGNKFALVYGVSNYKNLKGLTYPSSDANELGNLLEQGNYELVLKTDSLATKDAIFNDIVDMGATLKENDLMLFYFSGHGIKDYFLPYDADMDNPGSLIKEDEFASWITNIKTGKIVLLFDNCFSGGNIYENENCFVITASKEDELSWEFGDPVNHGIFTYYLLKGLTDKKSGITTDNVISLSELYNYIEPQIINYTTKYAIPQHPVFLGNKDVEIIVY